MLFLNLKTYPESTGEGNTKLFEAVMTCIKENPEIRNHIFMGPNMIELGKSVLEFPELNIFAQHVDNKKAGSTTGWVPAALLVSLGVKYAVINHAEHRVYGDEFSKQLEEIQSTGLNLIVPCENIEEADEILKAKPYAIAYENAELIGSGKSITEMNPQGVQDFIDKFKGKTKVIIGAGISSGDDVKKGLEMGADGYILASAFVKAADPVAKLKELVAPYLK